MHELNTEPFDCTVWSETSATQFTLDSICTKARLAKAYLATSTAAGSRMLKGATVTGRGHAVGSLVYSKCKARSLHKLWPDVVFQSGRVSDALITVDSFQLRVIGVYGYNSSITNADGLNEVLFEEIFRQAASFSLPTVIAGDFNFDLQLSPTWQHYSQLGYVDVGKHSSALAHTEPEPTYRGQSRLDYVVCNALAFNMSKHLALIPKVTRITLLLLSNSCCLPRCHAKWSGMFLLTLPPARESLRSCLMRLFTKVSKRGSSHTLCKVMSVLPFRTSLQPLKIQLSMLASWQGVAISQVSSRAVVKPG